MKQTAVKWLENELAENLSKIIVNKDHLLIEKLFEQAKEMEKQQIMDARINGDMNSRCISNLAKEFAEQYYNKEYGGKK